MNDDITVMTLNVYVGANVDRVLAVQDPVELPRLVAEVFQELLATNFPERAAAIADAIARARPQLIGLQEISTVRLRSPGEGGALSCAPSADAVAGNATDRDTPSAATVRLDYLDLLLAALASRGLDYRVAGCIQNVDITLPLLGGGTIQLVDSDVVLVRRDVHVAHVVTANYQRALTLPTLGITIPRGYITLDATLATHHTYRFVSTHLEPDDLTVQLAQAEELVATLASATQPVVVVGDLNTPAPTGQTYQFLVSQGYVDVWTRTRQSGAGAGYTFPHAPDLRNEVSTLTQRLDYIFVRPEVNAVCATIWGDGLADRTPSGLWPSDHAAVIAALRMHP